MTKSKGRASAKPRSGTKSRSKVKRANPAVHPKTRNRYERVYRVTGKPDAGAEASTNAQSQAA